MLIRLLYNLTHTNMGMALFLGTVAIVSAKVARKNGGNLRDCSLVAWAGCGIIWLAFLLDWGAL